MLSQSSTRMDAFREAARRFVFGERSALYGIAYGARIKALDALVRLLLGQDVYTRPGDAEWSWWIRVGGERSHGVQITPAWVPRWGWLALAWWHNSVAPRVSRAWRWLTPGDC